MPDPQLYRLLTLKVAKGRKGLAPNKPLLVLAILDLVEAGLVGSDGGPNTGSGRYSSGADTKRVDNVRIWYQADLVTA